MQSDSCSGWWRLRWWLAAIFVAADSPETPMGALYRYFPACKLRWRADSLFDLFRRESPLRLEAQEIYGLGVACAEVGLASNRGAKHGPIWAKPHGEIYGLGMRA